MATRAVNQSFNQFNYLWTGSAGSTQNTPTAYKSSDLFVSSTKAMKEKKLFDMPFNQKCSLASLPCCYNDDQAIDDRDNNMCSTQVPVLVLVRNII